MRLKKEGRSPNRSKEEGEAFVHETPTSRRRRPNGTPSRVVRPCHRARRTRALATSTKVPRCTTPLAETTPGKTSHRGGRSSNKIQTLLTTKATGREVRSIHIGLSDRSGANCLHVCDPILTKPPVLRRNDYSQCWMFGHHRKKPVLPYVCDKQKKERPKRLGDCQLMVGRTDITQI